MKDIETILASKPKVEDYDYQPYGYIKALQHYINKLEEQLRITNVSISLSDYAYEMLIDDEGSPFEINSWIPIATDRIKDPSRINEYIAKGLIRKRQRILTNVVGHNEQLKCYHENHE